MKTKEQIQNRIDIYINYRDDTEDEEYFWEVTALIEELKWVLEDNYQLNIGEDKK